MSRPEGDPRASRLVFGRVYGSPSSFPWPPSASGGWGSARTRPPFRVGDTVGVLDPPARPSKARATAAWSAWESKVRNGFLGGGTFFLIASVVTSLISRAQLSGGR